MNPGTVCRHRKETTHYLGGGHYVVVRPAWGGEGWLVEESDGFGSRVHASYGSRTDADFFAEALAATRPLYLGEATA